MVRYTVYSLDMWGHVPADCCASYGCDCVDEETGEHNDDRCDCHEECNDQFRVGGVDIPDEASDMAILDALADAGFLTELGRKVAVVDDYSDGPLDINDAEGRRLFHLLPEDGKGGVPWY
jgi:hypothetical protein